MQAHASTTVPHHRHAGGAVGPDTPSGPVQTSHRAGVRQRSQARDAAYPRRGRVDEHRAVDQAGRQGVGHLLGHPGGPGQRVALELEVGGAGDGHGDGGPERLAGRGELVGPAGRQQLLGLDAAGEAADQGGGVLDLRSGQEHLAGVGVRRARLGVEVVAVVPDRHQPEVVDRSEGSRAGADHDPARTAGHGQELAVAPGRARTGGEHDVVPGPEHLGEGGVEPVDVTMVGDAEHASAPAGERGRGRLGEQAGPVLPGQGRPDSPR